MYFCKNSELTMQKLDLQLLHIMHRPLIYNL